MGEGNFGVLWIITGLLAALFLGQTAWNTAANRTCTDVYGLPACLCRDVVAAGTPSLPQAAELYNACRYGVNVRSEALCALTVRGFLTPQEAARLCTLFPYVSEWEWKQLNPRTAGFMLNPAHAGWPWRSILQGRVEVGMTDGQVLAAWSYPNTITRTRNSQGTYESWVYTRSHGATTCGIQFRNGVVAGITWYP